jgi:glutamate dehydrogenase
LDPSPDPETSFLERQRLFGLPRSTWRDYDPALISEGGGVFERHSKSIKLSPQVRTLLGISSPEASPSEVITALLEADVDLLWNGGIGTYVKASTEDHRAAGDKSNDDVRVDANRLRCKVIGEGGNLGMTQQARIEFASAGGRVNTDFVDNAGGVNLSDHEVNLKVLFAPLVQSGALPLGVRNQLLRAVAPDVVSAVVSDNSLLSLRLSLDEARSRRDPFAFGRCIKSLKDNGTLDPARQQLPSLKRLQERAIQGQGLMRPELATLGAHAKMWVYSQLVQGRPLPAAMGSRFLENYFPKSVYSAYREAIENHLLNHEIVSTVATNLIVEYAGTTFFPDLVADTERTVPEIALAYLTATQVLGGWSIESELRAGGLGLSARAEQQAILAVEDSLRDAVVLFLHAVVPGGMWAWDDAKRQEIQAFVSQSVAQLEAILPAADRERLAERVEAYVALGLPRPLSERVARLAFGVATLAAFLVGEREQLSGAQALETYLALGSSLGMGRLHQRFNALSSANEWEVAATRAMRRVFFDHHAALCVAAVREAAKAKGASKPGALLVATQAWLEGRPELASIAQQLRRAGEQDLSLATLVVLGDKLIKARRAAGWER